jgi:hypothetical protein
VPRIAGNGWKNRLEVADVCRAHRILVPAASFLFYPDPIQPRPCDHCTPSTVRAASVEGPTARSNVETAGGGTACGAGQIRRRLDGHRHLHDSYIDQPLAVWFIEWRLGPSCRRPSALRVADWLRALGRPMTGR